MVVVAALEIALFSWNVTLMFLGLLIGPGCVIYTLSAFMMIVFRKLEKEREEGEGNVE